MVAFEWVSEWVFEDRERDREISWKVSGESKVCLLHSWQQSNPLSDHELIPWYFIFAYIYKEYLYIHIEYSFIICFDFFFLYILFIDNIIMWTCVDYSHLIMSPITLVLILMYLSSGVRDHAVILSNF